MRSSYNSTSKDLSLGKMIGEGGGPLPRTLAMVEEEEGTTMIKSLYRIWIGLFD